MQAHQRLRLHERVILEDMRTWLMICASCGEFDASRTSCAVVTGGKTDEASSSTVGIPARQAASEAGSLHYTCAEPSLVGLRSVSIPSAYNGFIAMPNSYHLHHLQFWRPV